MYIQITTHCNMECPHCCYSCGPGDPNAKHMSMETVKKALELCSDYGSYISIGGGEPTCHPDFWAIVGLTLAYQDDDAPWMATNGKRTADALKLANLARKGVFAVDLSRDDYHEDIDLCVVEAFPERKINQYDRNDNDLRGVRNVNGNVISWGRGVDYSDNTDDCVCEGLLIDPDGIIWACGCKLEQFGTVDDPQIPDDEDIQDYCTRARMTKAS